jgi:hypothetical protein
MIGKVSNYYIHKTEIMILILKTPKIKHRSKKHKYQILEEQALKIKFST